MSIIIIIIVNSVEFYNGEIWVEKEKRKWVRMINTGIYSIAICLSKKDKKGIANMHKKYRRQDGDPG